MSIESDIIEWAGHRPSWQRQVLHRIARGEHFSALDIQALVGQVLGTDPPWNGDLGLNDLPRRAEAGPPVRLLEIRNSTHLNALRQERPLTFEASGLTVVYGDNGSGKSGYSRLIKKLVRARHEEPILTDIFADAGEARPRAEVTLQIGDERREFVWPDDSPTDAGRVHFYDGGCGEQYLTHESEVSYRPSVLFLFEGLIKVCDQVREELDKHLAANAAAAVNLPQLDPATVAGAFLQQLSGDTTTEQLDAACAFPLESAAELERVTAEEARLRLSDPARETARLEGLATALLALSGQLTECERRLGDEAVASLGSLHAEVARRSAAAELAARSASFADDPVPGVGSGPWRDLWQAAKTFVANARPGAPFPPQPPDERCPLCQQSLDAMAAERFRRFEAFVQDATQRELEGAQSALASSRGDLERLEVAPAASLAGVVQPGTEAEALVDGARQALSVYAGRRAAILGSFGAVPWQAPVLASPADVRESLNVSAGRLQQEARALDYATYKGLLEKLARARQELQAKRTLSSVHAAIAAEIGRRATRAKLDAAKEATLTHGISRKAADLTREYVTTVVRDQFTRESDRLRLERVTLEDVGGRKGALQHQPAFVGAIQKVPLPLVLSEGEQTALGMAGFFTEVELEPSESAVVLDDPVSSLDHVRRGSVATRLASLAHERQVIVFTHDTAFVVDLRLAARSEGIAVAERFIERFRGAPGLCSLGHPWKVKDVGSRLQSLDQELAQIRRDRPDLDQEHYESRAAEWSGGLSETWERILSLEIAGRLFDRGSQEVRPQMFRVFAKITDDDDREFQTSYGRCSRWARRHDKSVEMNYVAPEPDEMAAELLLVRTWWERVKKYAQQ